MRSLFLGGAHVFHRCVARPDSRRLRCGDLRAAPVHDALDGNCVAENRHGKTSRNTVSTLVLDDLPRRLPGTFFRDVFLISAGDGADVVTGRSSPTTYCRILSKTAGVNGLRPCCSAEIHRPVNASSSLEAPVSSRSAMAPCRLPVSARAIARDWCA